MRNFLARYWFGYAMVLPVVAVLALLVVLPLLQGVYFGFTDINDTNIANPVLDREARYEFVGWDNYLTVLSGSAAFVGPVRLDSAPAAGTRALRTARTTRSTCWGTRWRQASRSPVPPWSTAKTPARPCWSAPTRWTAAWGTAASTMP